MDSNGAMIMATDRFYVQCQARNDGVKEWLKTTNGYRDISLAAEVQKILKAAQCRKQL